MVGAKYCQPLTRAVPTSIICMCVSRTIAVPAPTAHCPLPVSALSRPTWGGALHPEVRSSAVACLLPLKPDFLPLVRHFWGRAAPALSVIRRE
jgi:hypothetical protein